MPKRYWVMNRLTENMVREAAKNASKNHMNNAAVRKWMGDGVDGRIHSLYSRLKDREAMSVSYSYKEIVCVNGKHRLTARTDFPDRVLMHTLMLLIMPYYMRRLPVNVYNCVKGRGINAKSDSRRGDPIRKIKSIINTRRPKYFLQLDIRKCYENTRADIIRESLLDFIKDDYYIGTVINTCVCEHGLPIGAPTSPMLQHIVMMRFHYWCDENIKLPMVVYADDIVLFSDDKSRLNEVYWRIRNYLWYTYGYELKKESNPRPMSVGLDMLGVVFNADGSTRIRKSIKERARRSWHNPLSKASYMGMLGGADCKNLIKCLDMTDNDLFGGDDMLVTRRMSSPLAKIDDIGEDKVFRILDFELRAPKIKQDGTMGRAWFRMQISVTLDGKECKRLIKGSDPSICLYFEKFLSKVRKLSILQDKSESDAYNEAMALLAKHDFSFEHRPDGWCFKGTVRNED